MLTADKVLVVVGTPCSMSAVGSTETYEARVAGSRNFIAHAAFDAGLIDFAPIASADAGLEFRWAQGARAGTIAAREEIESEYGAMLLAHLGIRAFGPEASSSAAVPDIAAPLPHDLAGGGLRRLAGIRYEDIRSSSLKDLHGLFDEDPVLGPSLQSQLFLYTGLGALASLPVPLSQLLVDPFTFRVMGATAFPGLDSLHAWSPRAADRAKVRDRFALRLASSLASHGPALLSTMLAPSYSISRTLKNPALLNSLHSADGYSRVPQVPHTGVAACAAGLVTFTSLASQMVFEYPGLIRPKMALWTAADAALQPDAGVLDAFGSGVLMSRAKLAATNFGRAAPQQRSIADCLAPFDADANGTVVGDAGSGVFVTTLAFALENFLDITAIVVGWGQSGETGGKAHFGGVGFGGENAVLHALEMAWQGHSYGVEDFEYFGAHATGTRTNSRTELSVMSAARTAAAQRQGFQGTLPKMIVGACKAVGDGHTMGETGMKAVAQAIQYLLGKPAVTIPTLVTADPELGAVTDSFVLQREPAMGNVDSGALCTGQGFGGYNGAIALRAANEQSLKRYAVDRNVLAAYLEHWPELRRERELREQHWRRHRGAALELAQMHCWPGSAG